MKRIRAELVEHCGGAPSAVEMRLIDRACWLSLRLAMLDEKMAKGEAFSPHDSDHYISWSNALTRTIARLGLKGSDKPAPSLADLLSGEA